MTLSLDIAHRASIHELAAAFTIGREDLIPEMFVNLLRGLAEDEPQRFGRFHYYLARHIELDGGEHGHAARNLLERLCANDPRRWEEALVTARRSLEARLAVWDEIQAALNSRTH